MTSVGGARVDGDTGELVLKALLYSRLGLRIIVATLLRRLLPHALKLAEGALEAFALVFVCIIFATGSCGLFEPILPAHYFIVGVRPQVELSREFEVLVEFVVLKGVEVEDDPLEVDDQHVWRLRDQRSLAHIHLLLAAAALVVVDDLPLDERLQALMHAFEVLYGERQVVEVFDPVTALATLSAHELTAGSPTEDGLEKLLARGTLQRSLQAVEADVEELLGVLLLCCVRRCTVELLEGEAELPRVVVRPLRELEVRHELLQLVQHVVIDHFPLVLSRLLGTAIVDAEEVVPQGRDGKELLEHRVQVTDAAEVLKSDEVLVPLRSRRRGVVPGFRALDVGQEWLQAIGDKVLHQLPVPSQQAVEELVGGTFALCTEASCLLFPLCLHHLLHSPGHRLLVCVFLEDQWEEESGEDLID